MVHCIVPFTCRDDKNKDYIMEMEGCKKIWETT